MDPKVDDKRGNNDDDVSFTSNKGMGTWNHDYFVPVIHRTNSRTIQEGTEKEVIPGNGPNIVTFGERPVETSTTLMAVEDEDDQRRNAFIDANYGGADWSPNIVTYGDAVETSTTLMVVKSGGDGGSDAFLDANHRETNRPPLIKHGDRRSDDSISSVEAKATDDSKDNAFLDANDESANVGQPTTERTVYLGLQATENNTTDDNDTPKAMGSVENTPVEKSFSIAATETEEGSGVRLKDISEAHKGKNPFVDGQKDVKDDDKQEFGRKFSGKENNKRTNKRSVSGIDDSSKVVMTQDVELEKEYREYFKVCHTLEIDHSISLPLSPDTMFACSTPKLVEIAKKSQNQLKEGDVEHMERLAGLDPLMLVALLSCR